MTTTRRTDRVGAPGTMRHDFTLDFHGVRYLASDVAQSVAFYTQQLGFVVEHQHLPAFATVVR
jgi:hypothetical protein